MARARERVRRLKRGAEPRRCKGRVIVGRVALPGGAPVIEMAQLDVEHRGLQLVDAEVTADEGMEVLGLAAVHAQHFHVLGQAGIVGDTHAGIAEGTEVLGRKERQAPHIAEAAGARPGCIGCTDRLGRVLDDLQLVATRERHQRRHVGHLAVEMHRHQRPHSAAGAAVDELPSALQAVLGQELRDCVGREVESRRIDVEEQRPRAGAYDRARGGEEAEGAGDDLVTGADLECHQRQQQRIRARGNADPVAALTVGADGGLEFPDRAAQDEMLARAHLGDGRFDLRREGLVLKLKIEQRHLHGGRAGGLYTGSRHGGPVQRL